MSKPEPRKEVAGWVLLVAGIVLFAGASSAGKLAGGDPRSVVPILLGAMLLVGGSVAYVSWQR